MNTMLSESTDHIFIVEDNEIYSMMLDYVFTKDSHYKFSSFKTGEDCLRNLWQKPKVVILDYNLPGKNGYETLLAIKQHNPGIHVLMLTNQKDQSLAVKLLQAGAEDYMLKQGRVDRQISDKIESLLAADAEKELAQQKERNKTLYKKLAYYVAIASVIVAGLIYFT